MLTAFVSVRRPASAEGFQTHVQLPPRHIDTAAASLLEISWWSFVKKGFKVTYKTHHYILVDTNF